MAIDRRRVVGPVMGMLRYYIIIARPPTEPTMMIFNFYLASRINGFYFIYYFLYLYDRTLTIPGIGLYET